MAFHSAASLECCIFRQVEKRACPVLVPEGRLVVEEVEPKVQQAALDGPAIHLNVGLCTTQEAVTGSASEGAGLSSTYDYYVCILYTIPYTTLSILLHTTLCISMYYVLLNVLLWVVLYTIVYCILHTTVYVLLFSALQRLYSSIREGQHARSSVLRNVRASGQGSRELQRRLLTHQPDATLLGAREARRALGSGSISCPASCPRS